MYGNASLNMSLMHHRAQSSHALCFAPHARRFGNSLQLQVAYMLKVAFWAVECLLKARQDLKSHRIGLSSKLQSTSSAAVMYNFWHSESCSIQRCLQVLTPKLGPKLGICTAGHPPKHTAFWQ